MNDLKRYFHLMKMAKFNDLGLLFQIASTEPRLNDMGPDKTILF